jgi:hypothetical protein
MLKHATVYAHLIIQKKVEPQGKGEDKDEKHEDEGDESDEDVVEDDDVLAHHWQLAHVGQQIQPGHCQQYSAHLIHIALHKHTTTYRQLSIWYTLVIRSLNCNLNEEAK